MDLLDQLRAFVATAQTGSFTAAAEQLGVSNRLTSKYVAELESELGVRLFQRTTRRVGMTPAGEELLTRAPALLDDLDALLGDVSEGSRGFSGVVRISAPVTFGESYITPMLGRFAQLHPHLTFDMRLTDDYVDLASDGIDIAFRLGSSDMQSIKARKLGVVQSVVAASPAYLAKHGTPKSVDQLADHACIIDSNRRAPKRWVFTQGSRERVVMVNGRFQVNSARAACDLALAGQGIVYSPFFAIAAAMQEDALVPLITDARCEDIPISAVYLEGRALPRKIRALIDFAVEDFKAHQKTAS
ncbi:LysR family transcriptional regulator [Loktanella sp. S4079]|uniref:LysR family transcriptional regulator n=1 Tax=Loktanella sp. S4079 TaxID=579483 RepID=UPI0005F9C687|nr:LysR family transcriptional regulator [Loktanella sp. S4079]KJZ19027.1 LysR family transcriptional regulator [Loktanella sp. S4079]